MKGQNTLQGEGDMKYCTFHEPPKGDTSGVKSVK